MKPKISLPPLSACCYKVTLPVLWIHFFELARPDVLAPFDVILKQKKVFSLNLNISIPWFSSTGSWLPYSVINHKPTNNRGMLRQYIKQTAIIFDYHLLWFGLSKIITTITVHSFTHGYHFKCVIFHWKSNIVIPYVPMFCNNSLKMGFVMNERMQVRV